jgi:hypothetical protein
MLVPTVTRMYLPFSSFNICLDIFFVPFKVFMTLLALMENLYVALQRF